MITKKMLIICAFTIVLFVSATFSGCTSNAKGTPVQVTDPAIKNWNLTVKGNQEKNFTIDDLAYDLKDDHLKKMSLYLSNNSSKPPELGSFAYFIMNAITSKERIVY